MKFNDYDGRRKGALKRLESNLTKWNSHNEDKKDKYGNVIRSHEQEKERIENEIAILKIRLVMV